MIESSVVVFYDPTTHVLVSRLIDETFVEIPANALGQCSPPQTYPSEILANVSVTVNLSYSLGCSPNYQLCIVNTTLQCVYADESINGKSYTACVEGFSLLPLLYNPECMFCTLVILFLRPRKGL